MQSGVPENWLLSSDGLHASTGTAVSSLPQLLAVFAYQLSASFNSRPAIASYLMPPTVRRQPRMPRRLPRTHESAGSGPSSGAASTSPGTGPDARMPTWRLGPMEASFASISTRFDRLPIRASRFRRLLSIPASDCPESPRLG